MASLATVARGYRGFALLLTNTLLAFLLVNVLVFAALEVRRSFFKGNPIVDRYGEMIYDLYPGMARDEVDDLLESTWSRSLDYDPHTVVRESPITSRWLNVTEAGFRHGGQPPWPPDGSALDVFVFGGSTTFGYGLPDDRTVLVRLEHHLQAHLPEDGRAVVYNFGAGYDWSLQERLRFEQLLLDGVVPDIAVFIDGLNEFTAREPMGAAHMRAAFDLRRENYRSGTLPAARQLVRAMPVGRAAAGLAHGRGKRSPAIDDPAARADAIARYRRNMRMIEAVAASHDVATLFVWQPIPSYAYTPPPDDPSFRWVRGPTAPPTLGYPDMAAHVAADPPGDGFLWCADMQASMTGGPLYVDGVHYGFTLADALAERIAARLVERGLPAANAAP